MAVQQINVRFITSYSGRGVSAFQRDMNRMAGSANKAAVKAGAGVLNLGRASKIAGTALMVGVGAAMAVGIKAAIDFESSFAGVRKTVEASEPEFQALKRVIRDLALEIPVATDELNRIAELGGQLGIPVEDLENFTEVIALLGVTTNLEIEKAATAFARISNVMGTSPDEFDNMGSAVVDLGNNFATTEEEIVTFSLRLSGIGSTMGITEQDVLGLATAFTSLGEPAERGATALQRTFVALRSMADAGGPKLQLIAELMGLTAEAAADLIKADITEAFLLFEAGLGQVVDTGGDATGVLKELGLGAVRTTTLLLKGAAGIDIVSEALDTSNRAWAENVALNEEADKRFETTGSQLTLLGNQFKDMAIAIGDTFLPVVKTIIQDLQGMFGVVADSMPILAGFAVAIGLLAGLRGIGFLITKVGGLMGTLKLLRVVLATSVLHFGLLRTSVRLLGGVLGLAAIAFGAYIALTGSAKARSNEMEASVDNLREALKELAQAGESVELTSRINKEVMDAVLGATAGSQLIGSVLDEDFIRETLRATGTSITDWVDLILGTSGDLEEWGELARETLFGDITDQQIGLTPGLQKEATALDDLLRKMRQIREVNQKKSRQAIEDLALTAPTTFELAISHEIENEAQRIQDILKAALTPEQTLFDSIEFALGGDTEGQEVFEKILEDTSQFGDDFRDQWDEVIAGFQDTFGSWREAWSGYEEVTATSVDKIMDNIEAFNADAEKLLVANIRIAENYSFEEQNIWASLPEALRRDMAATLAKSPVEFDKLMAFLITDGVGVETSNALLAMMTDAPRAAFDFVENVWPARLDAALAGLPMVTRNNLVAAAAAGKLAFASEWEQLDVVTQAAIISQLEAMLITYQEESGIIAPENWVTMTDTEQAQWLREQGVDMATLIAAGFVGVDLEFIFARKLSAAAAAAVRAAKGQFQMESPSKVFAKIGEGVGEGFQIGLKDQMDDTSIFKDFTMKAHTGANTSPAVNVDVSGVQPHGDTNIEVHGQTKDLDASIRLAGTMQGIVRRMETKVGK